MRTTKLLMSMTLAAALLLPAAPALANHPVTVEGNCFGPGAGGTATGLQMSPVPPGSCGDFDGDGRIGVAEDADMDNNFGSINAAVTAVGNNGRITIVASGTFPESVRLVPTEGASIVLAAARGVDANIDAVVQGQAGNAERQQQPGIFIGGCAACRVAVRNLTIRNWDEGVLVRRYSRALLDDLRVEGNLDFGVRVVDRSRVTVTDSTIDATGYRKDSTGVNRPDYGIGLRLSRDAYASVYQTTISNNFAAGLSAKRGHTRLQHVQLFGNHPNLELYG